MGSSVAVEVSVESDGCISYVVVTFVCNIVLVFIVIMILVIIVITGFQSGDFPVSHCHLAFSSTSC